MGSSTPARRAFTAVLLNTFLANLTTNFMFFSLVFWIYLETRSVLVTSFLGGGYMLLMAVLGVPFGMLVDHLRKKTVMVGAQLVTAVMFAVALVVFLVAPKEELVRIGSPALTALLGAVLVGAIVESARHIAMSTVVTLLVEPDRRAHANGQVGIVNGLGFAVTSVFAGLGVGQLGMRTTMVVACVLTVLSLVHLLPIRIPEDGRAAAAGTEDAAMAPHRVDFGAAWRVIRSVPGLLALVLFATFNNLLGGVFMSLMDPYGLSLVRVEAWGLLWGILSFGFIIGGVVVARFGLGANPLRSMLVANVVMWLISMAFALRESIVLLALGILVYMALVPIVEAAEQTTLQRVVPYETQGRVFGLAQAMEVAAAPVSAIIIGIVADRALIPYMNSPTGQQTWGWLLGEGEARGIALVFVAAGLVGLVFTLVALASPQYRRLSAQYAAAPATLPAREDGATTAPPAAPGPSAGQPGARTPPGTP